MKRLRKPPALRRGDLVRLVAPAGPVDRARLDRGVARLSAAGYVVEVPDGVHAREGAYLAGSDAHRAAQFNAALAAPGVRAVVAARGGYGTTRILPLLDWKRAAAAPRLVVGYSDLSAVLSYLATRLSVPSIHGAMPAADLANRYDAAALDAFVRLAAGEVSPREPWGLPCEKLRAGAAEGRLSGGCLSVLTSLLGTPFVPDFRGALLFLEEVGEPAYRIDRSLTQWLQSGRWASVAGMVVGRTAPVRGEDEDGIRRRFADAAKALGVPCWYGFPAGHEGPNHALPFGTAARIDAKGRLFLLESPVGAGR
jgi:muramoyltetrapeptide carboxypeptidase